MATITEDYVSFETAKLLKEKRFKTPVETGYYGDGRICHNLALDFMDYNHEDGYYSRPTIQMAMKWLRKVHNIHITIVPCEVGPGVMDYTYILYKIDAKNFIFKDLEIQGRANTDKMSAPKTCEAAIKYCLENLI